MCQKEQLLIQEDVLAVDRIIKGVIANYESIIEVLQELLSHPPVFAAITCTKRTCVNDWCFLCINIFSNSKGI